MARSASAWYRGIRLLSRRRAPAAAIALVLAAVVLGITLVRGQHRIAQARFLQARQLANKVLELDEVAGGMHGSSKSMRDLVELSKKRLQTFVDGAQGDPALTFEVVEAYWLLARAEGICMSANSRHRSLAEESLRKADRLNTPLLHAKPSDRKVLLMAARISHDRMIRAENDRANTEAVAQARSAVEYLDRLMKLGDLSFVDHESVSELYYDVALSNKNQHRLEDGIRSAQRAVDTARWSQNPALRRSMSFSMLADLLRRSGDLEGAVAGIRKARTSLAAAEFHSDAERRSSWCRVLGREAEILSGSISLNRPDEARALLQKVFDLLEEWTENDNGDPWTRLLFISVGHEYGNALASRDPRKAVAVFDHALSRVREVTDNPEARRGEAELLAASTYALRRLNRSDEATARIGNALHLLAETNDYPAPTIDPFEQVDTVLRASAEHYAATGQLERAAQVYEDLLKGMMASNPDVQHDFEHAVAVSQIYTSLRNISRRVGRRERAIVLAQLRLNLWLDWSGKLPHNGFVRDQLAAARTQ